MVGIPRLLRRLPHDVLRLRVRRTAPGKPPTGYIDLYADATGALAGVDDAGAALSIGGGGGGGDGLVTLTDTRVSAADTQALSITPIDIAPAPSDPAKWVIPLLVELQSTYGTADFNGAANLRVGYLGGWDSVIVNTDAPTLLNFPGLNAWTPPNPLSIGAGALGLALSLSATGPLTDGDGTLLVRVWSVEG